MQIIRQPLPPVNLSDIQTRLAIGQRRKEHEAPSNHTQHHDTRNPASPHALLRNAFTHRPGLGSPVALDRGSGRGRRRLRVEGLDIEYEFDERARDEAGCKMRREVVVQEELATHDVEGHVVGGPGEEEETSRVVETGTRAWIREREG